MFYVSPIVGEYEGFEVGRFSKGATIIEYCGAWSLF